eukprot:6478316-Amphidinium_carterae.2
MVGDRGKLEVAEFIEVSGKGSAQSQRRAPQALEDRCLVDTDDKHNQEGTKSVSGQQTSITASIGICCGGRTKKALIARLIVVVTGRKGCTGCCGCVCAKHTRP